MTANGMPFYVNKLCNCRSLLCHRCARECILCSPRGCHKCEQPWRNIRLIPAEITCKQFEAWLGNGGSEIVVMVVDLLACAAFIHFMHPYVFDLVYGSTFSALTLSALALIFAFIFLLLLRTAGRYVAHRLVIPLVFVIHNFLPGQWRLAADFEFVEEGRHTKTWTHN